MAGFAAAGASAATSIRPEFAKGLGSVLPTGGGTTEVNISCPDRRSGNCRGERLNRASRDYRAGAVGKRVLASKSFTLRGGWDGDLKLRLDGPARSLLSHGPLFVTVVLRAAGSAKPVSERRVAIAHERLFSAPGRVTVARAADDGSEVFSFDWTIPAHNALVLKAFSCPESMPLVAAGRRRSQPAKPVDIVETAGELDAKAGSGTGYAGFDRANTKFYKGGINEWRNMTGWPKGDFFFNSIWAPLLNAGHFSLKVTCRNGSGTRGRPAARLRRRLQLQQGLLPLEMVSWRSGPRSAGRR